VETLQHSGSTAVIVLDEQTARDGITAMRERVETHLRGGATSVVVDIAAVPRLSSTLLASLLWTHRACQRRGGRVTLRSPNRSCREMLARTGLRPLFLPSTKGTRWSA
jgi:anti-anti-sigma factor